MINFDKFKHPDPSINGYYVFAEVQVEMLEIEIPEGVFGSIIELEDGTTRQKTIREFVLFIAYSTDGTKAIVRLCRMDAPIMRILPMGDDDVLEWCRLLEARGFDLSVLMNLTDATARLNGPDFSAEY
jgi:hypothetical protein